MRRWVKILSRYNIEWSQIPNTLVMYESCTYYDIAKSEMHQLEISRHVYHGGNGVYKQQIFTKYKHSHTYVHD